ncbi:MAG TPA: S8 family peptidase, partial [Fimbriimonadaceae bacterium]|nr:S8 family peptidase [Fimbriimonadaceae bacterium]
MKPKTLLLLGAALLSQLGLAQEAVPGEILVKFHTDRPVDQAAAHAPTRAHKVGEVPNLKVQLLRLPAGISTRAALDYYRSLPGVEYAEPNYIAHAQFTPNDISFNSQWGPKKIQAPQAWEVIQGSPDVIVAILDTGVDLSHPDLLPKLTIGWDFVNNDAWADDDHGHGTHCAGIAAAGTNNAIGVAGIGFNSRIMPVKVLGSNGSGSYAYIVAGIRYAADNGAKVISLSLGGQSTSYALEDAVNYAWSKGAIVVAAAGNANSTTPHYPAAYTNAIAVGASESNDARASYSNYGSWVDVAAPGSSILSTTRGGGYGYMSGTSMATPHVAGQAALVWSHYGASTSVSMIRQRIEGHTDPIGSWIKYGRVNVYKSIGAPPSDPPPSGDGRTE